MAKKSNANKAGGTSDKRETGSTYSLAVRIGALALAAVLIFGTLIITAIYM